MQKIKVLVCWVMSRLEPGVRTDSRHKRQEQEVTPQSAIKIPILKLIWQQDLPNYKYRVSCAALATEAARGSSPGEATQL